jgi:hypothetical protein
VFVIALFSNLWGVVSGDMGGSVKEGDAGIGMESRESVPRPPIKSEIRNGMRCTLVTK